MPETTKQLRWNGTSLMTALAIFVTASAAQAQQPAASPAESSWVDIPQSRVRLVGGADPSNPGTRVVLVEMLLQPNWKTYWRMPGDAGIPPSFDWTGSVNLGPVEVGYPAPSIFVDQGGVTIGYKSAVTFPVVTRPPDSKAPTQVKVELALGICREICIPVEAKLSLDIPADAVLPKPALAAVNAKVPVKKDLKQAGAGLPAVASIAFDGGASAPRLTIKTKGVTTLFLEAPDSLFVPLPARVGGSNDSATFEVDLKKTQDLPDLKGKTLTITAVGANSAIETSWVMPSQF